MSIRGIGTAIEWRFFGAPFTDKKKFMNKPRGCYEYFGDDSVYFAHWNDNNVAAMMTNFDHTSATCLRTAG